MSTVDQTTDVSPSVVLDAGFADELAAMVEPWEIADRLLDRYPESEFPLVNGGAGNGLMDLLGKYERHIYKEHGVRLSAVTMRTYRATAAKWPAPMRASRASFDTHARIRGEDRFNEMAKRLKQADREGRALSSDMLRRLRADEKGTVNTRSECDRLRSRIAASVKNILAEGIVKSSLPDPDWWNGRKISADQRRLASAELRRLADLIDGIAVDDG